MLSFKEFLIETYTYITETAFWPDWARSGSMVSAIRNNAPIVGHVAHIQKHPEYPDEGYHAHILTDGGHVHTFFFPRGEETPRRGDRLNLIPFLQEMPGTERSIPSLKLEQTATDYEGYQGRADDMGTHVDTGEPIIGSITGKPAESVFKFYQFMKDQLEY